MTDLLGELSNFRTSIRRQVETSNMQKLSQATAQKTVPQEYSDQKNLSNHKQSILGNHRGSSTSFLDHKTRQGSKGHQIQIENQIKSLQKQVVIPRNNSNQRETFGTFADKMAVKLQEQQDMRDPPKQIKIVNQILKDSSNQKSGQKFTKNPSQDTFFHKYLQNKQNETLNQSNSSGKENLSFCNQSVLNQQSTLPTISSQFIQLSPHKQLTFQQQPPQTYNNRDARAIEEQIQMAQLLKIQDVLIDATDSQFDRINVKYVEELIKLSGVIMYRVKNSKFYKQAEL